MHRRPFLSLGLVALIAACKPLQIEMGTDGKPLGHVNRLNPKDTAKIQYQMLDSVNRLRQVGGMAPLQLNAQLTAAAATHSRDMAVQQRPWHFGSDGSSPLERVKRTGYPGVMKGENISETYETDTETLSAWMAQTDTRAVIMEPGARDMGFAWYQEPNGKIWWTLVTGG